MSQYVADTLRRGQSGLGTFPVVEQPDISVGYIVEADLTALQAIPTWRRRSKMKGFAITQNKTYELQTDLVTWTDVTVTVPGNIVISTDLFDINGFIKPSLIQSIYATQSFVAVSQAAMLALTTLTGNIVVRTDNGHVYLKLNNNFPSLIGDFADITSNVGAVTSVNGMTGAVTVSVASLLAVPQNVTDFNTQVGIAPSVAANTSAISTLQGQVTALNSYVPTHLGAQPLTSIAQAPTAGQIGYSVVWNGTAYGLAPITATGAALNFKDLLDVPNSYAGQTLKSVRVNAAETGLEFFTAGSTGWLVTGNTTITGNTSQTGAFTNTFAMDGIIITQNARSSATWISAFKVNGGAHTGITASAELVDLDFALNRTVQWATGTLALQRAAYFRGPTYGFVGASTLTTAYNLYVDSPVAGTNATITNNFALGVNGNMAVLGANVVQYIGGISGAFGNSRLHQTGTVNAYLQSNIQNLSSGTGASSDWVATADTGSDTVKYVNMGINGSGNTDTAIAGGALNSYLYADGGNLLVGVQTANDLIFFTGGTVAGNLGNERIRLSATGLLTVNYNALASTQVNGAGIYFKNNTLAAAGVTQLSPSFTLEGQGWKSNATAASQPVYFTQYVVPVQGTTAPGVQWRLASSVNGAGAIDRLIFDIATTGSMSSTGGGLDFRSGAIARFQRNDNGIYSEIGVGAGNDLIFNNSIGVGYAFQQAGVTKVSYSNIGTFSVTGSANQFIQNALSSAWSPALRVTAGAHGSMTASTEFISTLFVAATQTWLSGTIATQRFNHFQGFTIAGATPSNTVTNAYTVYIDPSVVGTNAAITSNWALGVGGNIFVSNATSSATPNITVANNRASFASSAQFIVAGSTYGGSNMGIVAADYTILLAGGANSNGLMIETTVAKPIIIGTNDVERLRISTGDIAFKNSPINGTTWITFTQTVNTSGSPTGLLWTGGAHTGLTLSAEVIDINFALNRTVQFATGALTTQRAFIIQAPTYGFVGSSTITTAGTFVVTGAPVAGTNATITNSYSIWAQAGIAYLQGGVRLTASSTLGFVWTATDTLGNGSWQTAGGGGGWAVTGNTAITGNTSQTGAFTNIFNLNGVAVNQNAQSGAANAYAFNVTGGAHTTLSASTEFSDLAYNLNRTVQWATGALSLQRASRIQAPTYAFVGASVITDAATDSVGGAPSGGANATITNSHTLLLETRAIANTTNSYGLTVNANSGATSNYSAQFLGGIGVKFRQAVQSTSHVFVDILQSAHTGGTPYGIQYTGGAHTGLAASTEAPDFNIAFNRTIQWATGNMSFQRMIFINAPTLAFVGASIVNEAALISTVGAPSAGANATITNSHGIYITTGTITGTVTNSYGLTVNALQGATNNWSAQFAGGIGVKFAQAAQSATHTFVAMTQSAHTGGSPTGLLFTGGTHTGLAASTEAPGINFNLAQVVQFSTGALATQRAFIIQAPTYGFVGSSTITDASTVYIAGAPAAGTNATITNPWALYIAAGNVKMFGKFAFDATDITAGTTGAQTINKPCGSVNFAAAASTLVVTNSLATATSHIFLTVETTDTTAKSATVVRAAGSFTIVLNAAATAETRVAFLVIN